MPKLLITGDTTTTTIARLLEKKISTDSLINDLQVIDGDFNSWLLQGLDHHSVFIKDQPEFWIQIWSPRAVTDNPQIIEQVKQFLAGIKANNKHTKIIVTSFVVDPRLSQPIHQSFKFEQIAIELNRLLSDFSEKNNLFHVLNLQSFFTQYGLKSITEARFEALGRMYFSPSGSDLLTKYLLRGMKTFLTPRKKVLVLDLDNTLWGGILGEDGMDGIKIGGEGTGYLFTRFQRELLNLKQNGILLALCSKNNEEDALKVFREHPDMVIKLEDISAYKINWEPKSLNLKSIAEELNLGIDSLVFFDDSAFERENVRQLAPEVAVIEVPKDPAEYILTLSEYNGFDTFKITEEDKLRAFSYQQEAKRNMLKKSSDSLEDFYRSLDMKATLTMAETADFPRVHQLIWKTNQFNLTTKRYEESELKTILADKSYEVILLRLQDKMGESGITGVVILKKCTDYWEIENLMLSCRIIGRTVEFGLMAELAKRAKKYGAQRLKATFIKSERNQVAANFLSQAGLTQLKKDSPELWELNLNEYENKIPAHYVAMDIKYDI